MSPPLCLIIFFLPDPSDLLTCTISFITLFWSHSSLRCHFSTLLTPHCPLPTATAAGTTTTQVGIQFRIPLHAYTYIYYTSWNFLIWTICAAPGAPLVHSSMPSGLYLMTTHLESPERRPNKQLKISLHLMYTDISLLQFRNFLRPCGVDGTWRPYQRWR